MTKKDYKNFAYMLTHWKTKVVCDVVSEKEYENLVDGVALIFSNDNPAFSYEKFREACGL